MIKLAIAIQTPEVEPVIPVALLSGTWEEKLEKAARMGADGVELMTLLPTRLDAGQMNRQLESSGLKAASVASGAQAFAAGLTLLHEDPLRASQARMRLNQLIDFAAAVNAPIVTIGSFRGKMAHSGGQGKRLLADVLKQAAIYAAQKSIRLVIEPLNRYETDFLRNCQETLDFISEVGEDNIGILLDTFHVNIEECSWTDPFARACESGKLWHVHLGDNNRLSPGSGLINFGAIIAELEAHQYNGYLSAELLAKPDPDQAARQTLEFIRPLLRR